MKVKEALELPELKDEVLVVARIQLDEGSFIGWQPYPINSKEELEKYLDFPAIIIHGIGILSMEPAYKEARKNRLEEFVAITTEKECKAQTHILEQ